MTSEKDTNKNVLPLPLEEYGSYYAHVALSSMKDGKMLARALHQGNDKHKRNEDTYEVMTAGDNGIRWGEPHKEGDPIHFVIRTHQADFETVKQVIEDAAQASAVTLHAYGKVMFTITDPRNWECVFYAA